MNEERMKRFMASAEEGGEQEEAERLLQVAFYRRAIFTAYLKAGFTEEQAIRFLVAELSAPTIVSGVGNG